MFRSYNVLNTLPLAGKYSELTEALTGFFLITEEVCRRQRNTAEV